MKKNNTIEVHNLSKRYSLPRRGETESRYQLFTERLTGLLSSELRDEENYFFALQNINFELRHGEQVAIIGNNGAGKSTLLKILSRITHPSSGSFSIQGRVASLLEVGTGFHPELTGRENIFLNGAILGMSKSDIKKKFDEIVDFSGVEKFLDLPVKRYSSGMYMRLAFSVPAHLEPDVLIVDEILAVGDYEFQRKCYGKMDQAGNQGRTIIFVSHNIPAIQRLTRRAIWLADGVIERDGDTQACVESYLNKNKNSSLGTKLTFNGVQLDFFLSNVGNKQVRVFESGSDIQFNFLKVKSECAGNPYLSYSDAELKKIDFQIAIFTETDLRVTTLSSRVHHREKFDLTVSEKILVSWRNVPLASGTYYISVGLYVGGVFKTSWEKILSFEIFPNLQIEQGMMADSGMGFICPECEWVLS